MTEICQLHEIPDLTARAFPLPAQLAQLPEQTVVIYRRGLEAFAYVNRCPHAGTELNWHEDQFLSDDGEYLQCFTHGALFEPDSGRCVAGPCVGKCLQPVPLSIENGKCILG